LRGRSGSPAAVSSRNPGDAEARGTIAGCGKLPGEVAERMRGLSGSVARRSGGSTVRTRESARRREKERRRWRFSVAARVRVQRGGRAAL
jgi:hypothetical protein